MPPTLEIVYVRGGDKDAPAIAAQAGMRYGTRNDYKAYAAVHMIDIKWKHYDWARYLRRVDEYRPPFAMVADYEHVEQRALLYQQIRDLERLHIERIMICPKFSGALADIPVGFVVAVSIPTSYAGFLPDFRRLAERDVHLLGGRPEKQAEAIRQLRGHGANVLSVDGSYHAMKAGYGQWFDGGRWNQVRRNRDSDAQLCAASARAVATYLRQAYESRQLPLWETP